MKLASSHASCPDNARHAPDAIQITPSCTSPLGWVDQGTRATTCNVFHQSFSAAAKAKCISSAIRYWLWITQDVLRPGSKGKWDGFTQLMTSCKSYCSVWTSLFTNEAHQSPTGRGANSAHCSVSHALHFTNPAHRAVVTYVITIWLTKE